MGGGGSFVQLDLSDVRIDDFMASWWVIPKAVESGGRVNISGVQSSGQGRVYSVAVDDHDDVTTRLLITAESDDHNAAALVIETDKVPIVFYCRHNQDSLLRVRKGTVIGDITSLVTPDETITLSGVTTYAQSWRRPGTDEIHVFVRESSRYWVDVWSDDWFDTNETIRRVFDFGSGEQGYIGTVPIASDPTKLRVALTGHPTSSSIHDIYYCEIELDTGDILNLAGSVLGNVKDGTNLPLVVTALDKAVDTDTAGGHNARLFDIGDGPDPEIAYGDWTSDTNTIYYRTVWNGSSWVSTSIVAAGVTFGYIATIHYNGGVMFPRNTTGGIVYLSREDSGTWSIERWAFSGTWAVTQVLETGATRIVRPHPIQGGTRSLLIWHDVSTYTTAADASLTWAADLIVDGG